MVRGVWVLVISSIVFAQETPRAGVTCIKAGRIHTVSGAVIENGVILIENGKIVDVQATTITPPGAKVIDASDMTIIPGLIDTAVPEEGADSEKTISPDVLAVEGYDFFKENRRQLRGGVTTLFLSPGTQRLLSGQCAIVKTAGANRDGRILRYSIGLRVSLGEVSKNPPPIYNPPIPPSAEAPFKPVQRQFPSTRMGHFAELRKTLEHLADPKSDLSRAGREALTEAKEKKRPVFVSARTADDLVKTILFADENGLRVIFLDADEADQVADLLAEKKIPVWVKGSIAPGKKYDGDDERPAAEFGHNTAIIPALLKKGVKVALQSADQAPGELLLEAAYACRGGLTADEALRSVTLSAAELLGIENRVGSIQKGRDADLVFLSGPALSSSSQVKKVMVGGEIVFERKPEDDRTYDVSSKGRAVADKTKALAIQGVKIAGIPEALILIEDGRLTYVGKTREVPAGIKVIDGRGLTATPGFIDAHTYLGFHTDGSESAVRGRQTRTMIPATTNTPPSELIRLDDPAFSDAAAAGVTVILLAPEQGGVCSAIRTNGGDGKAVVLKDVAALKIQVGGGSTGYTAIKDLLTRARKYHDEWEAYERALKAEKDAPKAPAPPVPTEPPKPVDPVTGSWKGTVEIPDVELPIDFSLELKLTGNQVTGHIKAEAMGTSINQEVTGTFMASEIKIEQELQGAKVSFSAQVAKDTMKGKVSIKTDSLNVVGTVSAKRIGGEVAKAAPATGEKKEPKKEESLEPYRKLLRREIPALVVASDLSAIENAAKAFGVDNELDWTLVADRNADYAAAKIPGAIFGPDIIREKRGTEANLVEALVSSGVPVALGSSSVSGSRHLALNAIYAVRSGLDPSDGLKIVTGNAAKLLRLENRVGSLDRGRDADVVLFSGDPLDLSSRIRYVVAGGKVVLTAP